MDTFIWSLFLKFEQVLVFILQYLLYFSVYLSFIFVKLIFYFKYSSIILVTSAHKHFIRIPLNYSI